MGRLIDTDRLKAHYCWWSGGTKEMTIDEAKKTFDTIIDVQPTVDAVPTEFHDRCMEIEIQKRMDLELNSVEVVRCKDCKYYDAHWCTYWEDMGMEHTDFCSKAERKEDE